MPTLILLAAIAAAQPATSPASAAAEPPFARRPENVVMPTRAESRRLFTEWGFAEAVIDGDRIWLSGVVAGLGQSETLADSEKAYDRAFRIIGEVLARSGSSFDGVVEMTTFHTDIAAQMDGFMKVKHRYIREPFPAWTAIDIDRLVPDRGLVEIKIVARRRPMAERN